jgi:hypothetical protein
MNAIGTLLTAAAAITRVLNLNHTPPQPSEFETQASISHTAPILNEDGDPIWKILVFDNLGRDVISSVLRVNDLRTWGVTIHLYVPREAIKCGNVSNHDRNINARRYPIPDVPVVYLVEPSPENIQSIVTDLTKGLYSPSYINFLSSVPRPLLEDFAAQVASTGTAEHIVQVYDQYLNFIVAEPDLFTLGMSKDTYRMINGAHTKDEELDALVDKVVSGLFSVCVTMGTAPLHPLSAYLANVLV